MGNHTSIFETERNNIGSRASYMPKGRGASAAATTPQKEDAGAPQEQEQEKNAAVLPDSHASIVSPDDKDTSSSLSASDSHAPVTADATAAENEDAATLQPASDDSSKTAGKAEAEEAVYETDREDSTGNDKKSAEPRQKKRKASENTYKRRSSTLAGNEELKETTVVSLKLTPYTKALLEMVSKVSGHSCQSELADVAIHNYLVKEYAQFLPLVDMYYGNIDPDADLKALHKKK